MHLNLFTSERFNPYIKACSVMFRIRKNQFFDRLKGVSIIEIFNKVMTVLFKVIFSKMFKLHTVNTAYCK